MTPTPALDLPAVDSHRPLRALCCSLGLIAALVPSAAFAQTAVAVPVSPGPPPGARVVVAPPRAAVAVPVAPPSVTIAVPSGGGAVAVPAQPNAGFAYRPPVAVVPQPPPAVIAQPSPPPQYIPPGRPYYPPPPQYIQQPPQPYYPPPRDLTGYLQHLLRRTIQVDPNAANAICPGVMPGLGNVMVTGLTYQGSPFGGFANATVSAAGAQAPGMPPVACGGMVRFNYSGQGAMGPWGGPLNLQITNLNVLSRFAPAPPTLRVSPYAPPTSQVLAMGSVVQGNLGPGHITLSSGAFADDYAIMLNAGVPVTLEMRGGPSANYPGSNIDAYLVVLQNGVEITHDDDSGGNLNARVVFTPPMTGMYTIRATTFGSNSSGSYMLLVSPGYAAHQPMIQPGAMSWLNVGSAINGMLAPGDQSLSNGTFADDYAIQLNAGMPVTIVLRGGASSTMPGTTLDMYLVLLQNGAEITHDDDSAGNLNSRIVFTPPMSGTYQIRVTTWSASNTIGAYTLQVFPGANPYAQ